MNAPPTLADGFHPGLDSYAYLALLAVSNSWLDHLKIAPARLRAILDGQVEEKPDTAAILVGNATHAAVLEPDLFKERFLRAQRCCAKYASGNSKGEQCTADGKYFSPEEGWRCGKHKPSYWAPGAVLSPAQYDMVLAFRDNALSRKAQYNNARARKLLTLPRSERELTGLWHDNPTGERAKLRGDFVNDAARACADLKTCPDASPEAFAKTVLDRGYYRQQGHYNHGFTQLGRNIEHHYLVAFEKVPPFLCAVYRLTAEVMEVAKAEARQLLDLYHKCNEAGHWPGYPARVMDLALPAWGERKLRAALQLEVR